MAMTAAEAAIAAPSIELDVFADIACPWCFIAHRRLGRAIDATPALGLATAPTLRWRAFQLRPDMPANGVDAVDFFDRKFGGRRLREAAWAELTGLGQADGIAFAFDRLRIAPNTELAHRIIGLAQPGMSTVNGALGHGGTAGPIMADQRAIASGLFSALFEDGVDVGRIDQTLGYLLGRGIDLDAAAVRRVLEGGAGRERVREDMGIAAAIGIDAVPVVMANRRHAVWGAQPEIVFRRLLVVADSDTAADPLDEAVAPLDRR